MSNGSMAVKSSLSKTTEADFEVYLKYGSHCDLTLFVEYGFVNRVGIQSGAAGEVDIQDIVEEILDQDSDSRRWKQRLLEEQGYWGYAQHLFPTRLQL
jgi:hypothetical protein